MNTYYIDATPSLLYKCLEFEAEDYNLHIVAADWIAYGVGRHIIKNAMSDLFLQLTII